MSMRSILRPGTICITVNCSPENLGRVVVVMGYVGQPSFDPNIRDGYAITTENGMPFVRITQNRPDGTKVQKWNTETRATADRKYLKPIVGPDGKRLQLRRERKPRGVVAASKSPVLEAV